jgi:tellurite resistance protein
MGLLGLGLVWRQLGEIWPFWAALAPIALTIGELIFFFFAIFFLWRIAATPRQVWQELSDPASQNFIATFSISLLLGSEALRPNFEPAARVFFLAGFSVGMAIAAKSVIGWILTKVHRQHIGPTWFLPVVGNLVAPPIAAKMGYMFIGWMVLSFGLIGWAVLFPLILWRLWSDTDVVSSDRRPNLFIFVAPPALITSAYIAMASETNMAFPKLTFAIGVVTLALLLARPRYFLSVPFGLSWWSYTFPVHALTLSAFSLTEVARFRGIDEIAIGLALTTTAITSFVCFKAAKAVVQNWTGENAP